MKVYFFDAHFVLQKAISNWCLVHSLGSESYLFPPIHLVHCEMLPRGHHIEYDQEAKMSSTAQRPCFHPNSNIVHECPFHFSVCFRSESCRTRLT